MSIKIIFIILASHICLFNFSQAQKIILNNPSNQALAKEVLLIQRSDLEKKIQIPEGKFPQLMIAKSTNSEIFSQIDDLNGDGKWDELLIQVDIAPKSKLELSLQWLDKQKNYPQQTNIRMAKVIEMGKTYEEQSRVKRIQGGNTKVTTANFQMEGPGWENDKVAFRNYLDERNGFDIFGKKTEAMVLDKVGINEDYHKLQSWGMDILKVGNSLGAGAPAIWHKDSLYRVTAPQGAYFELLKEGPLRSTFNLTFDQIQIDNQLVKITHQVSITAGKYAYTSKISSQGLPTGATLATGIVKLHSDSLYVSKAGKKMIFLTHDKQAFEGEYLGMAIVTNKKNYIKWLQQPEKGKGIVSTFALVLQGNDQKPLTYDFYAGWERSNAKFAQRNYFEQYIKSQIEKTKVSVKIIP